MKDGLLIDKILTLSHTLQSSNKEICMKKLTLVKISAQCSSDHVFNENKTCHFSSVFFLSFFNLLIKLIKAYLLSKNCPQLFQQFGCRLSTWSGIYHSELVTYNPTNPSFLYLFLLFLIKN